MGVVGDVRDVRESEAGKLFEFWDEKVGESRVGSNRCFIMGSKGKYGLCKRSKVSAREVRGVRMCEK